ncbi:MAG: 2-hydroxyacid dehydrogenase [Lachnospiraceae bacterium]|nr:2-hydroxyacid dehydrogenase [Lachnospiraceae bacterium]
MAGLTKLLVLEDKNVFDLHATEEMRACCDITLMNQFSPVEAIVAQAPDAEILLANPTIAVKKELIDALPKLRLIQTEGVGFEGVDLDAAREKGIYVCNCRGVNALAVAEHAVMLMLCCLRDVINGHRDVLEGRQNDKKVHYMKTNSLRELGDCTVGFVGYGAIGREAARLTRAFGAKTLFYTPHPRQDEYAEYRPLDELLSESDIVSLNLPLTKETGNMADAAFFAKMKDGAILINTARGGLVNSRDLIAAIADGKLGGAGLDVLDNKPVQRDHVLVTAPEEVRRRIIFTPHIAGVTASSFVRTYAIITDNIRRIRGGERPVNIVNGL